MDDLPLKRLMLNTLFDNNISYTKREGNRTLSFSHINGAFDSIFLLKFLTSGYAELLSNPEWVSFLEAIDKLQPLVDSIRRFDHV